jgi:hypothetical protein
LLKTHVERVVDSGEQDRLLRACVFMERSKMHRMEFVEAKRAAVVVELSTDELGVLQNALNEILNGPEAIEDWEFQTRVGVSREEANALLDAVAGLPLR